MQLTTLASLSIALLFTVGCSTPTLVSTANDIRYIEEARKITERLQILGERCWSKEAPLYPEGVIISRTTLTPEIEEIAVNRIRDAKDGVVDVALFRVEIEADKNNTSKVRIWEASVDCGFLRACKRLGLTEDAQSWIRGGQSCTQHAPQ